MRPGIESGIFRCQFHGNLLLNIGIQLTPMPIPFVSFSGWDLNCELFPLIAIQVIMHVVSSIDRRITGRIESLPDLTGIVSTMPPVRSLKPSDRVPYFSASYDPCSLKISQTLERIVTKRLRELT